MSFIKKEIKLIIILRQASGTLAVLVGLTMIFAFVQSKYLKPLENPVLVSLKEQYDINPNNKEIIEQIRAIDLMARKAYFSARWQVKTGSYILLASVIIFIICQRLISGSQKKTPTYPADDPNLEKVKKYTRKYLIYSASGIIVFAIILSFLMLKDLPDPSFVKVDDVTGKTNINTEITASTAEEVLDDIDPEENTHQDTSLSQSPEVISQEETAIIQGVADSVEQEKEEIISYDPLDNFPFFRGKGSKGIVEGTGYPIHWDGKEGLNLLWKTKIPKPGYNSPIIWNNKIFLTGADKEVSEIYCIDKNNGNIIWTTKADNIPGKPTEIPETSDDTGLAAPTAATNGNVVCAIFATGDLICLDMEGNRKWAKNIGIPDNHYGHSSSLIIYNNILLVQYDHSKKASLIAFDVNSGTQIWETLRRVKVSWTSPVLAEFNGQPQLILNADPFVAAYDPLTGEQLWSVQGLSAEIGPSVGVNSEMVFAANEYAKLIAIKPGPDASIVWQDNEYLPEVASPVATDELLFIQTSYGSAACYDAKTGELYWGHDFDQGFYASPILNGDNLYLLDVDGMMSIIKVDKEFKMVAQSPLGESSMATPAFSDKKIYLRGTDHLFCIAE